MVKIYSARSKQSGQTQIAATDPQMFNPNQSQMNGRMVGDMSGMSSDQINSAQAHSQMQAHMRQQMAIQNQSVQMPMSGPALSHGMPAQNRQAPIPPYMGHNPLQIPPGAQPNVQQIQQRQPIVQQHGLTQQDQVNIQHLAQSLFTQTPKEKLDIIRANLQNLPAEQRASLQNSNIDPLVAYFRQQATKHYMQRKNAQAKPIIGAHPPQGNPSHTPHVGVPLMPNQPPSQFTQIMPNGDYVNSMNFNQIQSLQQNALESAKKGQQVVPASSGQAGLNRNPEQQNNSLQFAGPQQAQDQNVRLHQQQAYQNRVQQASRQGQTVVAPYQGQVPRQGTGFPNSSNAPNTPSRPAPSTPRAALQSQAGGLGHSQNQPQSNELPNLNKGVNQSQSLQNPGGKVGATSRKPVNDQKPNGEQPQAPQQQGPPRRSQQMVFEEQMKAKLASLPNDDERRAFMQKFKERQHQVRQQSGSSSAVPPDLRGNVNQPGMKPQPALNGAPPQQGQNQTTGANVMGQRQQPQRLMTQDQLRRMDGLPFPTSILGNDHPLRPPKTVVTWGDLKRWTAITDGLPPDSLQKLSRLQMQHASFQALGHSVAPVAHMGTAPMTPTAGFQIPSFPTPSDQEVQKGRAGFPNRLSHVSDDQIRQSIIWKRQTNWAQNELKQPRPAEYHAQVKDFGAKVAAQMQPLSYLRGQDAASQQAAANQQPQQPPKVATPRNQGPPVSAKKTAQTPVQEKKGLKRQSSDDVSEVPGPRTSKQPPLKTISTPQQSKRVPLTDQQPMSLQARNGPAQGLNQQKSTSAQGADPGRDTNMKVDPDTTKRLQVLREKVIASMPARRQIAMTPQEKAVIEQNIDRMKPMINRLQRGLLISLKTTNDEERIKSVLQTQLVLLSQFRNKDLRAGYNDKLTISFAECQVHLSAISQFMMECMQIPQIPPQAKGAKQQPPPAKETTPALNASNLQQQQMLLQNERQADTKKFHGDNRAPAAPTSSQSPFSFSPPPKPPTYGGPAQVTQDTLRFPEKKKRKPNTSAAPSPSVIAKASPQVPKTEPETQKPRPAPPTMKCQSKGCESLIFVDQAALQKHHADTHMPVSIADPLAFSLEKIRNALNLDEKGRMNAKKVDVAFKLEAPETRSSSSIQGSGIAKREPSSAAMSRVASQVSGSPAGKLLEPPRGTSAGKLGSRDPPRSSAAPASLAPKSTTATAFKEAWSDATFDPLLIRDAFSTLREPLALTGHLWQGAGEDPDLTSDSTSTNDSPAGSKPTPSPRLSNTSEDPNFGVDSMGGLALEGSDTLDLDEFLGWYPDGWKEQRETFGDLPPVGTGVQSDTKVSIVDDHGGDGLIPFDKYIADFGMNLDGMDGVEGVYDM